MFENILVVCVGNICRSPVGELLLRKQLSDRGCNNINVSSAGLGALVGQPVHEYSADLLEMEDAIDGASFKARQLDESMVKISDLILVMEKGHLAEITQRYPFAKGKVFLMTKWSGGEDIPDPYKRPKQAFVDAYAQIKEGVMHWLPQII